jgi:hypothetical protein
MKGITYIIMYWIAIVLDVVAIELAWFHPEPNFDLNLMNIWFIGFIARLLMYALVSLYGFLGLLWVMEKCKVKL